MRSILAICRLRGPAPCPGPGGAWTGRGGAGPSTRHPENVLYLRYFRVPGTPADCFQPTLPLQGEGPLPAVAGWRRLPEQSGSWLGTRYYPPVYPPRIPTRCDPGDAPSPLLMAKLAMRAGCSRYRACRNDRFEHAVGEPRGMEYRGVPGTPNTIPR